MKKKIAFAVGMAVAFAVGATPWDRVEACAVEDGSTQGPGTICFWDGGDNKIGLKYFIVTDENGVQTFYYRGE